MGLSSCIAHVPFVFFFFFTPDCVISNESKKADNIFIFSDKDEP